MSNQEDFIHTITTKFLRHVGSIERLKKSYDLLEKENAISDKSIGEYVAYVLDLKLRKYEANKEGNWENLAKIEETLDELKSNDIFKMIDKHTVVQEDEEDFSLSIESSLLRKAYQDYLDSTLDLAYDDSQFQNSLIVSLVIGLEILIAEIFKDYVNTMDVSEQVLKDKKIGYSLLKDIGSVEEAKSFLIDQYIEQLLRNSFIDWLEEFKKTIKIDLSRNSYVKNSILLINETIQRRHLIIHNDGKVNDLYLNKIDPSLREGLTKGEQLSSDYDYINDRISTFRTFGLILIYLYGIKKYRNDIDSFFMQFHGLLLLFVQEDFEAPRYIFKEIANNGKLEKNYQGMSMINYFLTYKLNNDDTINQELEEFDADQYGSDFILAKKILLEDENAEKETLDFLKSMDNDYFINTLTWPLLKLVKKSDEFKGYVKDRIESIAKQEMEGELIEVE